MRSVLASNCQAFKRRSSNMMLSILASLNWMACACESICRLCCPMCSSTFAANWAAAAGLRPTKSWGLSACTLSMLALCKIQTKKRIRTFSNCHLRSLKGQFLDARDGLHLLQPAPWKSQHQGIELLLGQRDSGSTILTSTRPLEAALIEPARRTPHSKAIVQQKLHTITPCVGKQVTMMGLG